MASIDTIGNLEFHAFCLSAMPGQAPLIFVTVPGARGLTGASGFSTSTDIKKRLARLLDLRVSSLKFYPDSDLQKFLRPGSLRYALANMLDPRVNMEKYYNLPTALIQNLNDKGFMLKSPVSPNQLERAIGANRLFEDDAHANLSQLCTKTRMAVDLGRVAHARYSCCQVRCSACGKLYAVGGYKTVGIATQKCSCCRGDPEGMRIITRRILSLRLGGADDAWEALRILLRRAVKAGHAEAVNRIALAGSHKHLLLPADLDLAIRSRRAGVLASVLVRCPPHIICTCLKATERHAIADNTFGGKQETALFFDDLRCRLLAAHHVIVADRRPLEIAHRLGHLVSLRAGLSKPARHLVCQFLSPDVSYWIISQLTEMLAGTDGLEIRIDW